LTTYLKLNWLPARIVAGAKITLENTGTAETRLVETDSNGTYQFVNLVPGVYRITIQVSEFKRMVLDGLQVEVQATLRADTTLDVGEVTETVEVSTQEALLQTEQSSLSQAVEGRTVQEMPLNGRNVMNLVGLLGIRSLAIHSED
jgi:Carboxypeptidase regulatory-like domain